MLCPTLANHGKQGVNKAMNLAFMAFIVAFGFVTAALLHSAELAIRGQRTGFTVSFENAGRFLLGFVYCMFVGPYIVLERGVIFWRRGGISSELLALSFLITVLWSFCSGIFVTQLLMVSGIVPV